MPERLPAISQELDVVQKAVFVHYSSVQEERDGIRSAIASSGAEVQDWHAKALDTFQHWRNRGSAQQDIQLFGVECFHIGCVAQVDADAATYRQFLVDVPAFGKDLAWDGPRILTADELTPNGRIRAMWALLAPGADVNPDANGGPSAGD